MNWAVGIDVGGTNLKAVAVSGDGTVLQRASRATNDGAAGVGEWTAAAREAISEFASKLGKKT